MRIFYFSNKQLEVIRKLRNFPSNNRVLCDDGQFRQFTQQGDESDPPPNFDGVVIVHKGTKCTVSYNGHEAIED